MSGVEKIAESDNRNPLESAEVTQKDVGDVNALKSRYENSSPKEKDTITKFFNDTLKKEIGNDPDLKPLLETNDKYDSTVGPEQINQLETFQLGKALSNYPYVPDIIRQSLEKTAYVYANNHMEEINDTLAENTEARNQRNFEVGEKAVDTNPTIVNYDENGNPNIPTSPLGEELEGTSGIGMASGGGRF